MLVDMFIYLCICYRYNTVLPPIISLANAGCIDILLGGSAGLAKSNRKKQKNLTGNLLLFLFYGVIV